MENIIITDGPSDNVYIDSDVDLTTVSHDLSEYVLVDNTHSLSNAGNVYFVLNSGGESVMQNVILANPRAAERQYEEFVIVNQEESTSDITDNALIEENIEPMTYEIPVDMPCHSEIDSMNVVTEEKASTELLRPVDAVPEGIAPTEFLEGIPEQNPSIEMKEEVLVKVEPDITGTCEDEGVNPEADTQLNHDASSGMMHHDPTVLQHPNETLCKSEELGNAIVINDQCSGDVLTEQNSVDGNNPKGKTYDEDMIEDAVVDSKSLAKLDTAIADYTKSRPNQVKECYVVIEQLPVDCQLEDNDTGGKIKEEFGDYVLEYASPSKESNLEYTASSASRKSKRLLSGFKSAYNRNPRTVSVKARLNKLRIARKQLQRNSKTSRILKKNVAKKVEQEVPDLSSDSEEEASANASDADYNEDDGAIESSNDSSDGAQTPPVKCKKVGRKGSSKGAQTSPVKLNKTEKDSSSEGAQTTLVKRKKMGRRSNKELGIFRTYQCVVCKLMCKRKYQLDVHMRIHTGERPYECSICGKAFAQKTTYERHALIHTDEKPHLCDYCGFAFRTKTQMVIHKRRHTGEKPYLCNKCGYTAATSTAMKYHLSTHEDPNRPRVIEQHECPVCHKILARSYTLKMHLKLHDDYKPHRCHYCSRAFAQKGSLNTHMAIHVESVKKYKCSFCGKGFIRNAFLNRHVMIHKNDKPHKCEVCGKAFVQKSNMKGHMRLHFTKKNF